jgi:hypothetical protein
MTRCATLLVAWLALAAFCRGQSSDLPAVLDEVRAIARQDAASCERLLSRASPVVQKAFHEQDWTKVEKALAAAGVKLTTLQDERYYRCVLIPKACAIRDGVALDLYVDFQIAGGRPEPTYAVPEQFTVDEASVGLSAALRVDHDEIRKGQWFARHAVVQEAIDAWAMKDAYVEFPVLESIDVSYGEVGSELFGTDGVGYRMELVLGKKAKGDETLQAKRRLNCIARASDRPGFARGAPGEWLSSDKVESRSASKLGEELRAAIAAKEASYHLFLRRTAHLVRQAMHGREWSAVATELKGQNLKLVNESSWQYGMNRKYLVAENAFCTASGQDMDLFLFVNTWRDTSKDAPTREMVSMAYPFLRVALDIPYEKAAEEARFGKDTAVHKALLHEEVREGAKQCGLVDAVEIYYDVVRDRWSPTQSWGFFVKVDTREEGDGGAKARLSFSVNSELDPPRVGDAKVLLPDFVSRDVLGEVRYWGGSSTPGKSDPSEDATEEPTTSLFLTRKGSPRWRATGTRSAKPVVAYSLGDLKTLRAETKAIKVDSREIYDDDVAVLSRFTALESLDLGSAEGVSDDGLKHLAGLSKLKSVTLSGELLTGRGFDHLTGLSALEELTLYSAKKLSGEGVAHIAKMKNLNSLALRWADALADEHLAQIAKLSALRQLDIWNCPRVTDKGLAHVATLANLEELSLSKAAVTPEGIAQLARLKKLQEISFGYTTIDGDALTPLSQIVSLEYVDLHGIDITDNGLLALAKLPRLKRVYASSCRGATADGVDKFKARLGGDFESD